jgi:hypothetical protein
VALETSNERPSFPCVLWLVGGLNRGSWTLPRRSAILVFLFRSLPQIAESGIPLRSRWQLKATHTWSRMRIGVPVLHIETEVGPNSEGQIPDLAVVPFVI